MRKRLLILTAIILVTFLLSFSLVFLRHKFEEAQNSRIDFIFSKEDYLFGLLVSTLFLTIPAFIFGFLSWLVFKKKQSDKVFHFVIFNLIGLTILLLANTNEIYKIWHYNKYQANIDYNESLKSTGGYLDTCITIVQDDIKNEGVLPNDYRILSYGYEQALTTIPRDTTNKYFWFDIIYLKNYSGIKTVRAASYLINFNHQFKRVYDVDAKDEKAKKQIERLKENFKALKIPHPR